nr:glucose--fructose oxidoreductase [Quercus suber]
MAPHMDDVRDIEHLASTSPTFPSFLIIGAGSRGNSYARALSDSGLGSVTAVAEPNDFKRKQFAKKYIHEQDVEGCQYEFRDWTEFLIYEEERRHHQANNGSGSTRHPKIVDGVFVCVKDEMHAQVVVEIAKLGLHIMCEKPLATTLSDCLRIQRTLKLYPDRVFAIGHVLRYSPHNMLLRDLLLDKCVIGDVLSMEHVEPVGWWHFSHSYVRGQWRKEKTSAPSLLTKSCHDIDFILWLFCSKIRPQDRPHLPNWVSSNGSLKQFRKARKPKEAGTATNCLSCPIKETCMYSASRIYNDRHLAKGITRWPIDIVNPEVETILHNEGPEKARIALLETLGEDYDADSTSVPDIESRQWYGRCVWESDNDVCDDQIVTFQWDDEKDTGSAINPNAKTATFHMIASTLAQCERRGRIYGSHGEISYDSKLITVHDFRTDTTRTYTPEVPKNSHHGGGDDGLTQMYVKAVAAVMAGESSVRDAQQNFLGCTIEDMVRSHAAVFAAEEARRERKVVDWKEWWRDNVEIVDSISGSLTAQTPGHQICLPNVDESLSLPTHNTEAQCLWPTKSSIASGFTRNTKVSTPRPPQFCGKPWIRTSPDHRYDGHSTSRFHSM